MKVSKPFRVKSQIFDIWPKILLGDCTLELIFPERLSLKFNDVDTSYVISFRLNPTFSTKKFWSISSILTGHTDFAATVSSLTSRRLPDVIKIQVSSIVHKAYLHVILISHEVS
jgi:hypothetical protein